jgi:hypothetical protein
MSDDLAATLRAILERLAELGVPYMLVGSVAALAYGRSRATQDFDLVVALDEATARKLARSLPADRFYASEEAAADAVRSSTLFNVIDMTTGWKVDLVPLKQRAFSRREFNRRREVEVLGMRVFVASLEDVILSKLEWSALGGGSARQLEDVRELARIAGEQLDEAYIEAGATELGVSAAWASIRASR